MVDFESTGTNVFEAEIITGHFIHLDESFEVVSTYMIECCPKTWSYEAEKVHGITKEQASKYKKFYQVYPSLIKWMKSTKANELWCYSNSKMYGKIAPYDYALLRLSLFGLDDEAYFYVNGLKPYSVHSLVKVLQDRFTLESYSLDNVCKQLGIELSHHDAVSDCLATVQIIKQLLPMTNREALYNYERGINEDTDRPKQRNPRKTRASKGTPSEFQDNFDRGKRLSFLAPSSSSLYCSSPHRDIRRKAPRE